ncbi:MAG: hypothetical protein HY234_01270 [Acidobacteria bacterium]|nr:hypothetical protein [Acidobacteriota bacterium]
MVKHNKAIPAALRATDDQPLRFSFKHLDFNNPKFQPSECCVDYFIRLMQQLSRFSGGTVGDFSDQNNEERRHIIDFDQTSEPAGFQNIAAIDAEQLGSNDGWQFAVRPDEAWRYLWRVHGILVDDVFYVVWLDQEHRLYPLPRPAQPEDR